MCAFVVLGLVFSVPSQEIGLGKRLRNDLFCVEWGVKQKCNKVTEMIQATGDTGTQWILDLCNGIVKE